MTSDSIDAPGSELDRGTVREESVNDNSKDIVSERRKLSVGTKPTDLSKFKSKGLDHILSACDRPTVSSYSQLNME